MESVWRLVMALAWDAYRAGSLPVGAVVLDGDGVMVGRGRSTRHEDLAVPGQLSNSRIAHAEINALAQLPCRGVSFGDHTLVTNVEPCCLCMGAALQTGVGTLHYGWRDPYAGAATSMTVRNPQVSRRGLTVVEPADETVEAVTGLLATCHYFYRRPGRGAAGVAWRDERPDLVTTAARPSVAAAIDRAVAREADIDTLIDELRPLLGLASMDS
ncbi:Cytosine/adenosine deaminase [Frankia canadensis]|uniref:Cytosine/adenosine deaminase n=1 Tax=Frankia canadensis TaxID=1836972 RepID=A0A2I2L2N4_9ACTN|nr:nucleoside deaminase [Frankia canadensis]SNQ52127.1 Cytosine/adenosine deaminase [Frankia canadensis]SOU59417.1 Cytosine/adenosine deaminase [Frankia canadensis]